MRPMFRMKLKGKALEEHENNRAVTFDTIAKSRISDGFAKKPQPMRVKPSHFIPQRPNGRGIVRTAENGGSGNEHIRSGFRNL